MKIGVFGIEFSSPNKGCSALGYSFMILMSQMVDDKNTEFFVVNRNTDIPEDVRNMFRNIHILEIKNKDIRYYTGLLKLIKQCDVVFDFTEGDSFTEIYGAKRFLMVSMMKQFVLWKKKPLVLGPQTYGPFKRGISKKWAGHIIKKSYQVFARDAMSEKYVIELSGRRPVLTNDIAFELPAEPIDMSDNGKVRIGINPSGLLWNGGYNGNNQFGLTINYQEYLYEILKYLEGNEAYEVHLISHVILDDDTNPESDNYVCGQLSKQFSDVIVAPMFTSPVEAKNYIASMDCFIGARMHATIASYSMGVPTIPVSYSRKFEGLYASLNYQFVISATKMTTEEAVGSTIKWLGQLDVMKESISQGTQLVDEKSAILKAELKSIIEKVSSKEQI